MRRVMLEMPWGCVDRCPCPLPLPRPPAVGERADGVVDVGGRGGWVFRESISVSKQLASMQHDKYKTMHAHISTRTHTYTSGHICTHIYMDACKYIYRQRHANILTYMHANICMYAHRYAYTYKYIYMHAGVDSVAQRQQG